MRLYNTLTRQVEELRPVEDGHVRMYTCGPTVYRPIHIGNLRTFLLSDLVRRVAEFEGYRVTQVVNFTDVGHMTEESAPDAVDRMELAAGDEGLAPREIAERYIRMYLDDTAAIGIKRAHHYPKATEHIPEMLDLTARLLDRGHAYVMDDGTVYFEVQSFPAYGALSRNTLANLQPGHRDLETDPRKRHHADFSLWKSAGTGRLMKWDSPWGEGFPGWHIECSAMSMKYLGERFDIHTGGADLVFPHHEDEIAQSDGAIGGRVISTWVHGGLLRSKTQKMAKSTGNIWTIADVVERGLDPLAFRFLCLQTRYRSEMDFDWEALESADRTLTRIRQRVAGWPRAVEKVPPDAQASDQAFREAVGGDLDTPAAVRILNETVSAGVPDEVKSTLLASWDAVLGLDLERLAREGYEVPDEVKQLLAERDGARDRGDFHRGDELRDRLAAMGWEVMDTPEGSTVRPLL